MAERPRRPEEGPRDPSRREALKRLAALSALALVDVGALSSCRRRLPRVARRERKVIVLGLDGLSPQLVRRLMAEGKLPHMARLAARGRFAELASTIPPQSPVAWASFITGRDPGGHGLYDFIQRDPETYLPYLSIARALPGARGVSVGGWRIPLSRGRVESLRLGRAFWEVLSEGGVPCDVYRLPTNFPPPPAAGARQLAGLGAPDLRGTYGEFSYYTEEPFPGAEAVSGGAVYRTSVADGRARVRLLGPANSLREGEPAAAVDFDIYLDRARRTAKLLVQGRPVVLREGEWSEWVAVAFEMMGPLRRVRGICRFYLQQVSPSLRLYASPVNIDPADPALPIASPVGFARELAERFGPFYTQGFPHDVNALRHGILDDDEYLHQSGLAMAEARRMYEAALDGFRRGLLVYYFSTSDRTQHMFWRTMDPRHPAHDPRAAARHGGVIEGCYRQCDDLVGAAWEAMDDDTTLIVLSDHGFAPYYRSVNLNTWLAQRNLLVGRERWRPGADLFSNADWSRTAAYGLGFNALYLNLEGREAQGSVPEGERSLLLRHLAEELRQLRDPETGERMIAEVYPTGEAFADNVAERAPDLIVGYAPGYRCSDASVLGEVSEHVVEENRDRWSGDHCIDRSLVPGMLLTSRPFTRDAPGLPDVTASILAEFGAEAPDGMSGQPVW